MAVVALAAPPGYACLDWLVIVLGRGVVVRHEAQRELPEGELRIADVDDVNSQALGRNYGQGTTLVPPQVGGHPRPGEQSPGIARRTR